MYSFRVGSSLLCSRAWASTGLACHEASSIRSMVHKANSSRGCSFGVGNDALQTTLGSFPCLYRSMGSRFVLWDYHPMSLKHLQRFFGEDLAIKTVDGRLL
jgi:hypothetical protein